MCCVQSCGASAGFPPTDQVCSADRDASFVPASRRHCRVPAYPPTQPRWGRNLECAGEDPLLSGEYAINFVQGFEHAKETPYPLQASACCKHFVANELESWNGTDRNHIDSFVPQQDLVDSYLPSFQACVEQGKATSIMCR